MKKQSDKLVDAGVFMKQEGFKTYMQRIKEQGYKNIVIVGGSHSGFGCAWMILNGPATYNRNNSINDKTYQQMPEAPFKQLQNCEECCSCDD